MIKKRYASMNKFRKRAFAAALATAVASTSFNIGSLAVNAGTSARGRVIVEFEELPEDIADQTLPIGGKKSDINFPENLEVLLYSEEAESEERTDRLEKLDNEEPATVTRRENGSEAPTETDNTAEQSNNGTQDGTVTENTDNAAEPANTGSEDQNAQSTDGTVPAEPATENSDTAGADNNSAPATETDNSNSSGNTETTPETPAEGGSENTDSAESAPAETQDSGSSDGESSEGGSPEGSIGKSLVSAAAEGLKNTFRPVKAYAEELDREESTGDGSLDIAAGSGNSDGSGHESSGEGSGSDSGNNEESEPARGNEGNTGTNEDSGNSSTNDSDNSNTSNTGTETNNVSDTREEATEASTEQATETADNPSENEVIEEPTEEASESASSKNETKEEKKESSLKRLTDGEPRTLEDVRWRLDREKSEYGSRFQTVRAGDVFYFVPNIKDFGLKSEVDLPEIRVTIVDEEESVSKNSVSEDGVSGNSVSGDNVSGNKAAFDQFMIVDGVKVSVTAPEGVFPKDAVLKVRKINDAESNAKIEQAVKEDMGLSDEAVVNGESLSVNSAVSENKDNEDGDDGEDNDSSKTNGEALQFISFDITITDISGNEIQPDTEYGNASITFSQANIVSDYIAASGEETDGKLVEEKKEDEEDPNAVHVIGGGDNEAAAGKKTLRVYHFDDSYEGSETLERSIDGNESSVSVEVDHFSPFTLGAGASMPVENRSYLSFRVEYSGVVLTSFDETTSTGWDYSDVGGVYDRTNTDEICLKVEPILGADRRYIKVTREGEQIRGDNRIRFIGDDSNYKVEVIIQDVTIRDNGYGANNLCLRNFGNLSLYLNNYTFEDRNGEFSYPGLDIRNSTADIHFNHVSIQSLSSYAYGAKCAPFRIDNSHCNLYLESDDNSITHYRGYTDDIPAVYLYTGTSELNIYCKQGVTGLEGEKGCSLSLSPSSAVGSNIFDCYDSNSKIVLHSGRLNPTMGRVIYRGKFYAEGGIIDADRDVKAQIGTGVFQFKGGTHKVPGNDFIRNGHFDILGGSIKRTNGTSTQYGGSNYYILNFGKEYAGKKVSALVSNKTNVSYGLNDTYVDEDGYFHLWYPTTTPIDSVVLEDGTVFVRKDGVGNPINPINHEGEQFDVIPYNPVTKIELDSTYMVNQNNVIRDFIKLTAQDGSTMSGKKYPGGSSDIPEESGFANNIEDITWSVTPNTASVNPTGGEDYDTKLNLGTSATCVLTAVIDDQHDKVWTGSERRWVFFIPEYKAVSDIKSSAGTDPVIVEYNTPYTNARNSSKKYTIFNTEYTVDPQEATAVADDSTNWTWEITTPDGITNDLSMGDFTPNQLGEYTLKATIPNGISEIPVKNFEKTFNIECKKSIANCTITVESPAAFKGKGTPVKAAVTVKDGTTTLTEGTDYTLEYSDNTDVTTPTAPARVTITGKGKYFRTTDKPFEIAKMPVGTITMENLNLEFDTFQTADQVCKYVNGDNIDTIAVIAGRKADESEDITGDNLLYIVLDKFYSTANELLSDYPKESTSWKKQQTDGNARTVANKKNYIYAMIKEGDNLYTVISTKQIVDDRTPPTNTVISDATIAGTTATVSVKGKDELSGIGNYYVLAVKKGSAAPSVEEIRQSEYKGTSSPVKITDLLTTEQYTFYAVTEDKAGNISDASAGKDGEVVKGDIKGTIKVAGKTYNSIQTKQEVDVITDKQEQISLAATGNSGVKKIEYFVSDKFYSSGSAIETGAKSATGGWAEYDDSTKPYIERNKVNYIYMRVTTNAGTDDKPDYVYFSSKGIMEDDRGEVNAVISVMGSTYSQIQPTEAIQGYTKKQEEFTITASGKIGVKKIEYYVSDKFYSTSNDIEKGATSWVTYDGKSKAVIEKNKLNYIYARVTTDAGTDTDPDYVYVSSKGIWEDEAVPTISSITASMTDTSAKVTVTAKDAESGLNNYYLMVKKHGEKAPTAAEIMKSGTSNTTGIFSVSKLTKGNTYDFYSVVTDKAGNISAIKSISALAGEMTAKIKVEDLSYDVLQGRELVEDKYYNEPKEIKITATGASKIEYFITNKFYSSTSELENAANPTSTKTSNTTQNSGTETTSTASKWSTYNDDSRPYLKKNFLNYIYAKITDDSGNTIYISSHGIWEDELKPKVTSVKTTPKDKTASGVVKGKDDESGIKYYYLLVKKTTEDAPKKAEDVKGGMRSEDGKFDLSGLSPSTKYNVYAVIEDKAGNLSEIKKGTMSTKKDSASANKAKAAAAGAGAGKGAGAGSGSNVDKRTAGQKDGKGSSSDSSKGSAVRDGVPFIEDASDGILIGREKTSGWDRIESEVGKAQAPAQVFVNMNGSTEVPAAALKECENRDITYYFLMNDDITWAVNGLSFTEAPKNIDFRVRTDTKNIPSKLVNEIADVYPHTNLTLEHSGEFGFTAILSLNVGENNEGMYANLYYYNEDNNSLEFIESTEVDGSGRASFDFVHASDYTVILRGDALTDKSAAALADGSDMGSIDGFGGGSSSPKNVSKNTGHLWLLIVSIISFLLCGFILFMPDKKKKRRGYAGA